MTRFIIPLLAILIIALYLNPLDTDVGPPSATLRLSETPKIDIIDPAYQYADLITVTIIKTNRTEIDLNDHGAIITGNISPVRSAENEFTIIEVPRLIDAMIDAKTRRTTMAICHPLKCPLLDKTNYYSIST